MMKLFLHVGLTLGAQPKNSFRCNSLLEHLSVENLKRNLEQTIAAKKLRTSVEIAENSNRVKFSELKVRLSKIVHHVSAMRCFLQSPPFIGCHRIRYFHAQSTLQRR